MPSPSVNRSSPLTPPSSISPEQALDKKIATLLNGNFASPAAASFVEDYLAENHCESLLVYSRELALFAEAQGYDVTVRFCTSKKLGHPVPLLTIRSKEGDYAVPNINQVWDPVIPLERGVEDSREKRTIAAEEIDDPEMGSKLSSSIFAVERFPKSAPVQIAIIPSDSSEVSVQAIPFFSDSALDAARENAARRVREDDAVYSYVLDEVVYPAIRSCIREESALFGQREIPELLDEGTSADGKLFQCATFVPMVESTEELHFKGVVVQDGLRLAMRFLEGGRD
jgi:hypothetical protein